VTHGVIIFDVSSTVFQAALLILNACLSGVDAICNDDGSIILESGFYTVSHLQLSSNVTIFVQSIDSLGFPSDESISATGVTQHSLSDVHAPVITSFSLFNAHCALIQWSSVRHTNPSWSYSQNVGCSVFSS